MRILVRIVLVALALVGVERLCHRATDGFAMVNVFPPRGENGAWHREEPLDPAHTLGTYRYLDSGAQSYVFLAENGESVLKLFKFQHMRTPPWLEFVPTFPYLEEKRKKKRGVLEKTFNALSLAYDHFREESGLLYLHLTKTSHLGQQVTIIDKVGKRHTLNLDKVPFLLQKRGDLAYTWIDEKMGEGKVAEARAGLLALLNLSLERCMRGIFDKDPDFSTNFGFVGDTPFQIDFGRFEESSAEKNPEVHGPEMVRITRNFRKWIENNHPLLLPSFDKHLTNITE